MQKNKFEVMANLIIKTHHMSVDMYLFASGSWLLQHGARADVLPQIEKNR